MMLAIGVDPGLAGAVAVLDAHGHDHAGLGLAREDAEWLAWQELGGEGPPRALAS